MSAMNLDLCPRCKKLYFECETILPNGELGCSCQFWLVMRDQTPATPLSKRHPTFAQAQTEAERLCRKEKATFLILKVVNQVRPAKQKIFSGDDSRSLWRAVNEANTLEELQGALYLVCCRLQELESRLSPTPQLSELDVELGLPAGSVAEFIREKKHARRT